MGISDAASSYAASAGPNTISRRGFLAGAVTLAAVAVLPLATAERAAAAGLSLAPARLTRSTFAPLLQATFAMVDGSGRSVDVILSQIDDLNAAASGSETRFSLMFDGPTRSPRPQATYSFRSAGLAPVSLFVVPVDRGISARHYQAVIYSK